MGRWGKRERQTQMGNRVAHWIKGFNAAIIEDGKLLVADDWNDYHGEVGRGAYVSNGDYRGLYNPEKQILLHLLGPGDEARAGDVNDVPEEDQLEFIGDHKAVWMAAAEKAGIPVKEYGQGYLKNGQDAWEAIADGTAHWIPKTSHWIPGFHAAIYDPDTGYVYVAESPRDSHGETGADEDNYDVQYRGLYNPNTQILLNITAGDSQFDAIDGMGEVPPEYQAKQWAREVQQDWLDGAFEANLPVREYGYAYEIDGAHASPWYENYDGSFGRGVAYKIIWPQNPLTEDIMNNKTSHWIPGFYAALMSADDEGWPLPEEEWEYEYGEEDEWGDQEVLGVIKSHVDFIVATDPSKTHTETLIEKTGLDENEAYDIMEYESYRGLYNPQTGTLLHMSEPGEIESKRQDGGRSYIWDDEEEMEVINPNYNSFLNNAVFEEAWMPEELEERAYEIPRLKQTWIEAATKNGYQVNEFGIAYFDPDYIEMEEIPNWRQGYGLLYKIAGHKESHWIPGFIAAVIGEDGHLYVGDSQYDNHGNPAADDRILQDSYMGNTHRGLYDPKSQTLLHITTSEEYNTYGEMPNQFEASNLPDHSKEWLEAAAISGIPVKHYGYAHEARNQFATPWQRWDDERPDPRGEWGWQQRRKDIGWGSGTTWTITHHPNLKAHISGWIKEGTKLDWLKSRPDKALATEEGQALLKFFEQLVSAVPNIDVILPWLVREWKKGRLKLRTYKGWNNEEPIKVIGIQDNGSLDPDIFGYDEQTEYEDYWQPNITQLEEIANWVKGAKPDLMTYEYGEAIESMRTWLEENIGKRREKNPGTIVYQFPDGWTIRSISTIEQCKLEGHSMKNCIKDYNPDETILYSLRDPQNAPHVSIEMDGNSVIQMYGKTNTEPYAYADYMRQWFTDTSQWPEGVYYYNEDENSDIYYLGDVPSFGAGVEINEYGIKSWNPDEVTFHFDDLITEALYSQPYDWETYLEHAFKWARYQGNLFQVEQELQEASDNLTQELSNQFDDWLMNNGLTFQDESGELVPDSDEWYAEQDTWQAEMEQDFFNHQPSYIALQLAWDIFKRVSAQRMAKTAHWIPGYHAIVLNPNTGKANLAKSDDAFHDPWGWNDEEWNSLLRGLYNPETQDLLHLTTMDELTDAGIVRDNYAEMLADPDYDPEKFKWYKEKWLTGMSQANIPVKSFGVYTFDPDLVVGTYNESMRAWNRAKPADPQGYNIRRSHWVPGFLACIIDGRGEFKLATGYRDSHGTVGGWGVASEGLRGLYNPDTQTLLHMSSPEQYNLIRGGLEIPYKSMIDTGVWDARPYMEEWITTADEYDYDVKAYGYAYEDYPESSDPWQVQMGGGLGTAKYEIIWEGNNQGSMMRRQANISPRAQYFIKEYINAFGDPMTERETYDMLFKYNTDSLRDPVDRNLLYFFFSEVAEAAADDTVKYELNEAARMLKEMPREQFPDELSGSDRAWMNEVGVKWTAARN